jgi:hypothetical protein
MARTPGARTPGNTYVAECFWSGVRDDDLRDLDRRIEDGVAELSANGESIRYVGSLLIVDDEVVLCLFEGPIATVRRVTERAGVPFGRILQSTAVPWSNRPWREDD